jgi:quinoprotein glucose dehydrogenase
MPISRRTLLSNSALALLLGRASVARAAAQAGAQPATSPDRGLAMQVSGVPDTEWRHYAKDQANTRYVPLDQINAQNFSDLEVAWRFKPDALGSRREYQFEATPLLVKGRLFLTAGARRDCVALDAATGELLWMYRIDESQRALNAPRQLSGHGCAYWTDGSRERILFVSIGYRLICLDAATGVPDPAFGTQGIVDLKQDIDQDLDPLTADIGLHSTPLIIRNMVVVGAAHSAGDAPKVRRNVKGYVRAFDVATGKRKWIFHTIPRRGEYGYDSWVGSDADEAGNCGVWSQMSADEELGLVYLPVELPTSDYVGIYRRGNALFGDCVVAVDADTGIHRWHFQMVHHGLWDSDPPCAPILCDIPHNGKIVKALAQPTKQNFLWVLDRATGKPLWPVVEHKVPGGDIAGEWYSPTQPYPSKPPAYDTQGVSPDQVIDFTPELHREALELLKTYKIGPLYTPPSMSIVGGPYGTIASPGSTGGTNWPGGCYDPDSHTVFVYSKTQAQVFGLIENSDMSVSEFPLIHGIAGLPAFVPAPMGAVTADGRPFPGSVTASQTSPPGSKPPSSGSLPGGGDKAKSLPFPGRGQITVQGLPLMKPPYGRITAINLETGDFRWQVAHGETPDNIRNHPALKGLKIPRTGRDGLLGPLCTKTLVICGEAGVFTDSRGVRGAMLRAYDKATGEEKGAVYIPAPQSGSPMTYMLAGRQYIVVAISGGNYSAELLAFRLPVGE